MMCPTRNPPKWLFFDCFNTLIDEPRNAGPYFYLEPVAHLPVEAGFCTTSTAFLSSYAGWHLRQWSDGEWREVTLFDRLQSILARQDPARSRDVESLVSIMVTEIEEAYVRSLRLAPGVQKMLKAWQGNARMAVVSNFYLPGRPEQLLRHFDLVDYFEFVLDSATCGWKKPGSRIYHEALGRAGLSKKDASVVTFIGDSLVNDVIRPRELGMGALHLDRCASTEQRASQRVADIIANWNAFRPDRLGGS